MARRGRTPKREIPGDIRYQSPAVTRIVNRLMMRGQKLTATGIVYDAMDIIEKQEKTSPVTVVEQAIKNSAPLLEVKPRRVGGATYQVPIEVRQERALTLAVRWLVKAARARGGKSMAQNLAAELADAAKGQGATVKKREDTHKMAEANRAFAHYRW